MTNILQAHRKLFHGRFDGRAAVFGSYRGHGIAGRVCSTFWSFFRLAITLKRAAIDVSPLKPRDELSVSRRVARDK